MAECALHRNARGGSRTHCHGMVARQARPNTNARLFPGRDPRRHSPLALSRRFFQYPPLAPLVHAWGIRVSNIHPFPVPKKQSHLKASGEPTPAYAELAVTTNFSFLRGASHPEELVKHAITLGLAGIGISDRNSVAGVVRAHVAAKELNG